MIPQDYITAWSGVAPWASQRQVEQDLIISRALVAKPHAHVMFTMRSVEENGFGQKVRDWNRTEMVERWRERWAEPANERLAELDIDARIHHRSLEAQGIALEPQSQSGAPAQRIEGEGLEAADRAEMNREIARNNGARIIADLPRST